MKRRFMNDEEVVSVEPSYITLNQNLTDPAQMISGDVGGQAIQWIRDNSHRYLVKRSSSGVVYACQLDDTNSSLYHDGVAADLTGSEGDVLMLLPRFFYHSEEISPGVWNIGFSDHSVDQDWKEWDGNDFIGVYKSYVSDGKARSWSGRTPSVNVSQANFKAYAEANGDGYSIIKFRHHSMMAFLFYALYGNTDSQSICGTGDDTQGKTTGGTNSLGMTDTVTSVNGNTGSINFWGLENWWGDICEWVDNVSISGSDWSIMGDDGSVREVVSGSTSGFISTMLIGENLDLVPMSTGATLSTSYCDYWYMAPVSGSFVLGRSYFGNYAAAGVALAYTQLGPTNTTNYFGSRLAYHGDYVEVESSADFKSIT